MAPDVRISVVIPVYNRESRIAAAIESALAQELRPLEVIVVDDGSGDHSADVADDVGAPVRVIRTANHGPSSARNRGIREARGDWIAFLDSDDTWAPDKLRAQARVVEAFPEVDLVFTDTSTRVGVEVGIASRFDLGGVREAAVESRGELLRFDRSLFTWLLEESRIFTSAVLVRRELEDLEFPERFKGPEDWALWLNLALGHEFAAVDRVLVEMNYDGDNLTATHAPILGRGVSVLEELAADRRLTDPERRAVAEALRERRVGALYHSLVEGDGPQARRLVADVPASQLGWPRWLAYWVFSRLPGRWMKVLARRRLG